MESIEKSERATPGKPTAAPDSTAVWVALWRALHVEVGSSPLHLKHLEVKL